MHTPEPITGTILVVDRDERLPQQRRVFEEAGFTVISAKSAKDGLQAARAQRPDVVVSEVMLERPDAGFVLGQQMKRDAELAATPLVLVSSLFQNTGFHFDLNSPEERRWIKADAYFERPIPDERLVAKVISLLRATRLAAP
ncbi:MAG: response regulator [Armatimonadota bacterium]